MITKHPERPEPRKATASYHCAHKLHGACAKLNCTCDCHAALDSSGVLAEAVRFAKGGSK